jgi:hypothetical protein
VTKPLFRVNKCVAPHFVVLRHYLEPNTRREFQFAAQLGYPTKAREEGKVKPFAPVRWEWDFGDGVRTTTRTPVVVHAYKDYVETTATTDFLVRVEAFDATGYKLVGRDNVALHNPAFEAMAMKKVAVLEATLNPRFPEIGADGKIRHQVRLRHHRPDDVIIESVTRVHSAEDVPGEGAKEVQQPLEPESVLGTRYIAPGVEGCSFSVEMTPDPGRGFAMDRYLIVGRTVDGHRAEGQFSVMTPPPAPTAKDDLVQDPALMAKIMETQRILGKPLVTDADITRLEREGRFASLAVDPRMADRARQRAREQPTRAPMRPNPPASTVNEED